MLSLQDLNLNQLDPNGIHQGKDDIDSTGEEPMVIEQKNASCIMHHKHQID